MWFIVKFLQRLIFRNGGSTTFVSVSDIDLLVCYPLSQMWDVQWSRNVALHSMCIPGPSDMPDM